MLKTVRQPKKQSSPAQMKFTKKWAEIEKKQKRNQNLQKKIATLYTNFQSEILPEEQKVCEMIAQETRHLMTFLPRKSFSKWQYEELSAWIESNIETLTQHPFCPTGLDSMVREEYNQALLAKAQVFAEDHQFHPDEIADIRDLIEELMGNSDQFSDQELNEFLRDPTSFHHYVQDFLEKRQNEDSKAFDEDELDREFFEDIDEEGFYDKEFFQQQDHSQTKQQKKLKDLFNASQLKKCYKILAGRLHPDKEQDPVLKAQKSVLMAQLTQAKKDKDAFTIISLFQQYVPDNDLNLDDDLNAELIMLLSEKSAQLNREHQEMLHTNTIESMVWQKLGGRTKKEMLERKQIHLNALLESQAALQNTIASTKTMKPLNKFLSERYERRNTNPFMNFEDLEALFDNDFDIFSDGNNPFKNG